MKTYLRIGDDYLGDAKRYSSKQSAVDAFEKVARELDRYGQVIEASLHYAPNRDELSDYPDYVLSIGPRGGVRCDRA